MEVRRRDSIFYADTMRKTKRGVRLLSKPIRVIAVAGGSCSGKSTVAAGVAEAVGAAIVISTDQYYRDLSHLPLHERSACNFDHPDALEHELLIEHMGLLAVGKEVEAPQYDFATHTRLPDSKVVEPEEYVILEGLYALHWEGIRDLAALRVFVELDHETCLDRRVARDVRERGRNSDAVRAQYEQTVIPMYEKYILPKRATADIVLLGDAPIAELVATVLESLPD